MNGCDLNGYIYIYIMVSFFFSFLTSQSNIVKIFLLLSLLVIEESANVPYIVD